MKTRTLIILTVLLYIAVMAIFYAFLAFVKLESDYHLWSAEDRVGWVIIGSILSFMPISGIWIYRDDL